jgi:hypothetical protein
MRESSKVPVLRPRRSAAFAAAGLVVAAAVAAPPDDTAWRSQLTERGRTASATITEDGYSLNTVNEGRAIPSQDAKTETASVLFDALFALAQDELGYARVEEIRYSAFNDNQPVPCACLVAGQLWPWVWTRDTAYATDLGLFRFDPLHARSSLEFKLSAERAGDGKADAKKSAAEQSSYIVQDTGSGGSWPVSTDRISWFLGARHLLGDAVFAGKVYKALVDTLAQDRRYVFDTERGLYRGETSFLDWREQTYPAWTAHDVTFIAESYALSTNVLYYEALQLAATMAQARHADPAAYRQQALALKAAIDNAFWREDRGMYMSYVGNANSPRYIEAYDLLGTSLAIVSGVAPPTRARRALAAYPTWNDGSPVIWPEREEVPVYHNRAIWPFASAYALKAARALDEPARIAHELRSIMSRAALTGSNMENFELFIGTSRDKGLAGAQSAADLGNFEFPKGRAAEAPHEPADSRRAAEPDQGDFALPKPEAPDAGIPRSTEHGPGPKSQSASGGPKKIPRPKAARTTEPKRSGPAVNSRRQLWSIGAYLDLVVEGVFGLTERGTIEPKLPRELLPMLFDERKEIQLTLADRRITLIRPAQMNDRDNLLIAGTISGPRADTRVQLRAVHVESSPLPLGRPVFAAATPAAPTVERDGEQWRIRGAAPASAQLYVNERSVGPYTGTASVPFRRELQCISLTAHSRDGVESLPSKPVCVGESDSVGGDWPRAWTAQHDGRFQLRVDYSNPHGPIMTGVTAGVKMMAVQCAGAPVQSAVLVMPHSEGRQQSTAVAFDARAGQRCTFTLDDGFNMSYLAHYAKYTAGDGGVHGAVNTAEIGDMRISAQR